MRRSAKRFMPTWARIVGVAAVVVLVVSGGVAMARVDQSDKGSARSERPGAPAAAGNNKTKTPKPGKKPRPSPTPTSSATSDPTSSPRC